MVMTRSERDAEDSAPAGAGARARRTRASATIRPMAVPSCSAHARPPWLEKVDGPRPYDVVRGTRTVAGVKPSARGGRGGQRAGVARRGRQRSGDGDPRRATLPAAAEGAHTLLCGVT